MRVLSAATCLFGFLLFAASNDSRQQIAGGVAQDPQAMALIKQALSALGGSVPQDSVATGTVSLVEGSRKDSGTICIRTRGTDQTSEEIQLPQGPRILTFSPDTGAEKNNGITTTLSLERVLSSQSACFPLPFLFGAVSNHDEAIQFIGMESLNGQSAQHLRLWNTFGSQPELQRLAEFTLTDVWLDASNALPLRISLTLREGGGSLPRIPLDVYFANYQNLSGVAYPFLIQKSLNGTPWMTITISNVSFNSGLTDAGFFLNKGDL